MVLAALALPRGAARTLDNPAHVSLPPESFRPTLPAPQWPRAPCPRDTFSHTHLAGVSWAPGPEEGGHRPGNPLPEVGPAGGAWPWMGSARQPGSPPGQPDVLLERLSLPQGPPPTTNSNAATHWHSPPCPYLLRGTTSFSSRSLQPHPPSANPLISPNPHTQPPPSWGPSAEGGNLGPGRQGPPSAVSRGAAKTRVREGSFRGLQGAACTERLWGSFRQKYGL